jgi:hypothetical protein
MSVGATLPDATARAVRRTEEETMPDRTHGETPDPASDPVPDAGALEWPGRLAAVPGAPESALPSASPSHLGDERAAWGLVSGTMAQDLENPVPPAPWTVRGSATVWLARAGQEAGAVLPAGIGGSPFAVAGAVVGYDETPVGPYDEVLGAVLVRSGLLLRGHVPFMAVDRVASLLGGRLNWGLPKTLARFTGRPGGASTVTAHGGAPPVRWRVAATARHLGPPVPLRGRTRLRQRLPDGSVGEVTVAVSARGRLCTVTTEVESGATLPTWLVPGRHPGALLERFRATVSGPVS